MTLAIDVAGLNKHFGARHVVKDLNLQIGRGEIFGFLGPNGSGKTTSIRMLCGLLTPDSGHGQCLGFDLLREHREIKRRTGYMTQKFSFWDDLSIRENLDFFARLYQLPQRRRQVDAALERLGLGSRASQLAGTLSGGWKQRLALAACMLHEPELLLLDEPTAGVDPSARRDFWEELHRLAASGISVLVSTHYMDEAERCHKLAYIAWGQLLAQGSAASIIAGQALHTWQVSGAALNREMARLQHLPGVEQTVIFGSALHVSGRNEALLSASLQAACAQGQLALQRIPTGLEDVFIHLMQSITDQTQGITDRTQRASDMPAEATDGR